MLQICIRSEIKTCFFLPLTQILLFLSYLLILVASGQTQITLENCPSLYWSKFTSNLPESDVRSFLLVLNCFHYKLKIINAFINKVLNQMVYKVLLCFVQSRWVSFCTNLWFLTAEKDHLCGKLSNASNENIFRHHLSWYTKFQ